MGANRGKARPRRLILLEGLGGEGLTDVCLHRQPREEARAAWESLTQGMEGQDVLVVLAKQWSLIGTHEVREARKISLDNILGEIIVHWEDDAASQSVQTVITVDGSRETVAHVLTPNYRRMFSDGADCLNSTLRTLAGFRVDVSTHFAGQTLLNFSGRPACWFNEVVVRPPARRFGQVRLADTTYSARRIKLPIS